MKPVTMPEEGRRDIPSRYFRALAAGAVVALAVVPAFFHLSAASRNLPVQVTTLDANFPGGYQVCVADVDGDGRPDVIGLGQTVAWLRNPTWEKRPITEDQTHGNIDLAPYDIAGDGKLRARVAERRAAIGKRHDEVWAKWQEEAHHNWDASPITFSRLALEVWEVIKNEDWVLSANTLKQQVRKLWDFDKPYRHPGVELGTSTQIGISLGVALAHKGTGRVVVDIQPDGDLMFDAGALWVAAKYEIPMLVVMHNNRAYYNDWQHQIRMAKLRGTDEAKAHIGMDLFAPEPDFGALARAMGCHGEGPIDKPQDIRPALLRALAEVKKGRLALVDTITQHR